MNLTQYELLQKGTTSLIMLVTVEAIESKGGDIFRLALHSRDVVFDGELYPAAYLQMSEFESKAGVEISNATFQTALASTFDRLHIKGGKWQGASVTLKIVGYENLSDGYIQRQYGRLGQSKIAGREAETEFRGLMQLLSQEIGERTSRLCRYQLGDGKCTKNTAAFTFTGTVTAVANKQKFTISVSKPDDYFYRGRITFTSGANNGLSMETQSNAGQVVKLFQPMLLDVSAGDTFSIVAGDDKTLKTCHEKFANAVNFGGEPSIPDRERLYRFPE